MSRAGNRLRIIRRILKSHFPDRTRQDVLDAVGLSLDAQTAVYPGQTQRRHDPAFREKVLFAYEYRCCVCGHDLRTCGHDWVATSGARSRAHRVVPGARECLPNPEFLAWHRKEVFNEPARE